MVGPQSCQEARTQQCKAASTTMTRSGIHPFVMTLMIKKLVSAWVILVPKGTLNELQQWQNLNNIYDITLSSMASKR